MGNTDIEISELCELKYSHPAFMDFQFIKCLANTIGVEVSLGFKAPGKMIFRISVSKADVVFSNLIKCSKIGNIVPDIPIYTTDLEELILKN